MIFWFAANTLWWTRSPELPCCSTEARRTTATKEPNTFSGTAELAFKLKLGIFANGVCCCLRYLFVCAVGHLLWPWPSCDETHILCVCVCVCFWVFVCVCFEPKTRLLVCNLYRQGKITERVADISGSAWTIFFSTCYFKLFFFKSGLFYFISHLLWLLYYMCILSHIFSIFILWIISPYTFVLTFKKKL